MWGKCTAIWFGHYGFYESTNSRIRFSKWNCPWRLRSPQITWPWILIRWSQDREQSFTKARDHHQMCKQGAIHTCLWVHSPHWAKMGLNFPFWWTSKNCIFGPKSRVLPAKIAQSHNEWQFCNRKTCDFQNWSFALEDFQPHWVRRVRKMKKCIFFIFIPL